MLLNIVVSLTSTAYRYFAWLSLVLCTVLQSIAQPDTLKIDIIRNGKTDSLRSISTAPSLRIPVARNGKIDTINAIDFKNVFLYDSIAPIKDPLILPNKKRIWTIAALHAGLYTGSMIVLNKAWYADYPRSSFQTFNDWNEWLQIDKIGHAWSAYQLSRASMASWKWAGLPHNKQVWLGGMMGFAFQTVIEIQDGFSAEWGWSWGDIAANTLGSAILIGQELGWKEQRINFKFGFHRMQYNDATLNQRSDDLFGSSLPERMLKDYNGQTYWLSANLKSFFKQSNLPPWLNIAVGFGATGMFGATENIWTDENTGISYNRSDISRDRQFYIAPDIDFTKIKTHSRFLKSVFFCLNAFKMPAPTLVFSKGKMRVHGFYF